MTDAPRLYLLTPRLFALADLAASLDDLLSLGLVECVRLRLAEGADGADWARACDGLREICHGRDVALVAEDHVALVGRHGLDGVHLSDPRANVRAARKALGPDRIVGAFAGASRHQGMTAAEAGADYVSFGPVWRDPALGGEDLAGPDLFGWWAEMIETPVVAEGGLTPERASTLAGAADFWAPCVSVWDGPEGPAAALDAYRAASGG